MTEPDSKTRILAAAKELILAKGYAAATVDAICERAGLTKGSFYHFYDSKEELGRDVLRWSLAKGHALLSSGAYREIADPVERALGYVQHLADCSQQLWSGGCLLGTFASELSATNPRMRDAVSTMFQQVNDFFAAELQPIAAAVEGADAQELADQFLCLLEGAIILAKAHQDSSRIPKAILGFHRYLRSLVSR